MDAKTMETQNNYQQNEGYTDPNQNESYQADNESAAATQAPEEQVAHENEPEAPMTPPQENELEPTEQVAHEDTPEQPMENSSTKVTAANTEPEEQVAHENEPEAPMTPPEEVAHENEPEPPMTPPEQVAHENEPEAPMVNLEASDSTDTATESITQEVPKDSGSQKELAETDNIEAGPLVVAGLVMAGIGKVLKDKARKMRSNPSR